VLLLLSFVSLSTVVFSCSFSRSSVRGGSRTVSWMTGLDAFSRNQSERIAAMNASNRQWRCAISCNQRSMFRVRKRRYAVRLCVWSTSRLWDIRPMTPERVQFSRGVGYATVPFLRREWPSAQWTAFKN
jgi:hypothetical protein